MAKLTQGTEPHRFSSSWGSAAETAVNTSASGLALPAARYTILFAWVCVLCTGILNHTFDFQTPLTVLAYALAAVGVFTLTEPKDAPLGMLRSLVHTALALLATAIVLAAHDLEQSTWLVNFAAYLLNLQIVRGNIRVGLAGSVVQILMILVSVRGTSQNDTAVLSALTIPFTALILALVWRNTLRRIVARERQHRSNRAESQRRKDAVERASFLYRQELHEIQALVSPTLTSICNGESITDEQLTEIRILEAGIRDRIRAKSLQHRLLVAAARRARSRDVTVTMLSDTSDIHVIGHEAAQELSARLDEVRSGGTAVISSTVRKPGIVQLVIAQNEQSIRITVSDQSHYVPHRTAPGA